MISYLVIGQYNARFSRYINIIIILNYYYLEIRVFNISTLNF